MLEKKTFKERYQQAIQKAFEAAANDKFEESRTYSLLAIATAIWNNKDTGVSADIVEAVVAEMPSTVKTEKAPAKRMALGVKNIGSEDKGDPVVGKAPAPTVAPAPVEAPKMETEELEPVETCTEWTKEAELKYQDLIDEINQYIKENGVEKMNKIISDFSDGVIHSADEILPLNIKALVAYMRQCA